MELNSNQLDFLKKRTLEIQKELDSISLPFDKSKLNMLVAEVQAINLIVALNGLK